MENKKVDGKIYVSADSLLYDSFLLGKKILESGFRPNFLVGIWRGGAPVGIAVQEFLQYHGIKTDHIAIRTSGYNNSGWSLKSKIKVHNLGYIADKATSKDKMLIIDDVHDTGLSLKAVLDTLKRKLRDNTPKDIRIATVYFKPEKNKTDRIPDYYIHKTSEWIVFPHELYDLSVAEIIRGKGEKFGDLFDKNVQKK